MAIENGMIVCSLLDEWPVDPVHREQKTVSHVSQNKSSFKIHLKLLKFKYIFKREREKKSLRLPV